MNDQNDQPGHAYGKYLTLHVDVEGLKRDHGVENVLDALTQVQSVASDKFNEVRENIVVEQLKKELAYHKPGAQVRTGKVFGISQSWVGQLWRAYKRRTGEEG